VATDGLWDDLTSQEAVAMVYQVSGKKNTPWPPSFHFIGRELAVHIFMR
jgi:serine/threonine protein phosphatase PrpC